jgi:hypothetical protein
MAIRHLLWGAALGAVLSATVVAQQSPGFFSTSCVKVKPGKDAEFNALANGDIRKFEQSRVDSGAIAGAEELRTIRPAGSQAECDYVFVTFYSGLPNAPMGEDETAAALKKAGISDSLEEVRQKEDAVGYLVRNSIDRSAVRVGAAKEGDYIVVNEMKVPDEDAWIANEKKLWQPLFEDGQKDGAIDGWAVVVRFMPRGAQDPYATYTVDIYPNWQSLFTFFGPTFPDRWKKVHPDVPMAEGMAQERKMDTIEHTVLYKVVSEIQAAK